MSEIPNNPLKSIFKITAKGKISEEIGIAKNIDKFFKYLKEPNNPSQYKVSIIEEFIRIIKINRYICEFFSSFENQSIYIFLFDLYLESGSSRELKIGILSLIRELILNIQADKKIFEYIFQKLASVYRGEDKTKQNSETVNDYLKLLNVILSDTENKVPPNNYFACSGDCQFSVDLHKLKIKIGCSFTIILNFKIGTSAISNENMEKGITSNLMNIHFTNGYSIKFDLQYPVLLIVKEIRDGFIKTLPNDEWINLIINLTVNDNKKIFFFFYVNGENNLTSFKLPNQPITSEDTIKSIDFFNNFYGEVSSITMLSQKGHGLPGVNASDFLQEFKQYKEGIWKKKKQIEFLDLLRNYDEIGKEKQKSQTVYYRGTSREGRAMTGIGDSSKHKASYSKEAGDEEEIVEKKLIDNLVFIFTPFNYSENRPNIVESSINKLLLKFSGNIKNHKYQCFQKKLALIGGMTYFFPIADMFLVHPTLLSEKNFEKFLEIITNILKYRKKNMELIKECQLFKILSLFFEKYPNQFFTENILDAFTGIGKVLFSSDIEGLNSTYFQNILLNEKILSKYSEELQLKFWNNLMLFCQSDSTQMGMIMNINSVCLILRFYDRNKYTEMCCEKHMSMIREGYVGSRTVMDPPMNKKLSQMENIIGVIINSIEPKNSIALFKLLTLDLSPCLTKFIVNIFTKAFKKKTLNKEDEKWKDKFVDVMIENNFETIIINTFVHSLPEIRLDILQLMYEIYFRMVLKKKEKKFKSFEKLIKIHFLPQEMFYASKEESSFYVESNSNKKDDDNIENNEENYIEENTKDTINETSSNLNNISNININEQKPKEVKSEPPKEKINPLSNSVMIGQGIFNPVLLKQIEQKPKEVPIIKPSTSSSATKPKPPENKTSIQKSNNANNNDNAINNVISGIKRSNRFLEMINKFENQKGKIPGFGGPQLSKPPEKTTPTPITKPTTTPTFKPPLTDTPPHRDPNEPQYSLTQTNFYPHPFQPVQSAQPLSKPPQIKKAIPIPKKVESPVKINNEIFPNVKVEKDGKILILKEQFYFDYLNDLYNKLLLWSFGKSLDTDFGKVKIKECSIKNTNGIEMIFALSEQLNDIVFTLNFLKNFEILSDKPESAYQIILNKNLIIYLLDSIFANFKNKNKDQTNCYNRGKSIMINIFINSLAWVSKCKSKINPFDELESFFIWGDKVIESTLSDKNKNTKTINEQTKENLFDFLNEILFECLTAFKIKYEPQMNFNVNAKNFNIKENNIFLKNYFIFISHLYRFSFLYKHDPVISTNGSSFIPPTLRINSILDALTVAMRVDPKKGQKVAEQWSDCPFFDDIYLRVSLFWRDIKNYKPGKKKMNTFMKYEDILKKMILDKDKKNLYQKELELFCLEEEEHNNFDQKIIPLIRTIPIALMCMILTAKKEEDFLYWLKEFKRFVRFLIIASSNMTRTNQQELYNKIQDKVLSTLVSCLCFFRDLPKKQQKLSKPCQKKIEKSLYAILTFCLIITKYQYKYNTSHKMKKLIKNSNKPARNDLSEGAVFILFDQYIKDKAQNPLLNPQRLEELEVNQYFSVLDLIKTSEWDDALFENTTLKNKLDSDFFCIYNYVQRVDARYKYLEQLKNESIKKTSDGVLKLLPLYEKELMKYSNNSIELNKKFKNKYKNFKKQSFIWRGFWSDRILFYHNSEKLKLKIINHYTKTLMKPILVPILDISYYLPKFSGFKPENLFNPKNVNSRNSFNNNDTDFNLIMDIDKILKLSEQNQIAMNNIMESFYEKKKTKKENFIRKIYIKSNPKLAESLSKFSDNLDLGKDEEFVTIEKDKSKTTSRTKSTKKYFLSCLVKTSHHIKGVCFIDDNCINFKVFMNQKTGNAMNDVEVAFSTKDDDYDQERQTCFGSYFVFHPKDKDLYNMSINYNNIKWIFLKRYYYKNSGLEIFTLTNKSYYFNFKIEDERDIFLADILSKLKEPTKIVDDLKGEEIIGYENTSVIKNSIKKQKKIKMSKKIDQWKSWEITNYEFLMWLNIYANRSYNDISQYPVFPWVLTDYEYGEVSITNDYEYRDLSLPMGMLDLNDECSRRKEQFLEMYETLKESEDPFPYFYGSNYSNPMYVCNFLMRLFPFTHISIELQGSKFDDPNRLFTSVANSFYNSTTQKTDLRELIPEFFYMPEMFLNVNNLNMGVQDNGTKVNDVLTPCKDNPYEFIISMKNVLESEKLSNGLQNWIDLIFGSKSRGGPADLANNRYTQASYQENINISEIKDKAVRDSTLRQVEFGLIPNQLMTRDFGKIEKKEDIIKGKEITTPNLNIQSYKCKKHEEKKKDEKIINELNDEDMVILKSDLFIAEKITLLTNNGLLVEKKIGNLSEEITNVTHLEKLFGGMSEFYSSSSTNNNKVIHFCFGGKFLIMGGFYDSKIVIFMLGPKIQTLELSPFIEDSPIVSIEVNKEEEYLFLGNTLGNIIVIKIDPDVNLWKPCNYITDQIGGISHICCNDDLNIWASSSNDGYINLYTLPLCKLVRSIEIPKKSCSYGFLTSAPLPAVIAISDEGNVSEIFAYSINGKSITTDQEYYKLINPIIIKDLHTNEYLSYVGKDCVIVRSLPDLNVLINLDGLDGVHTICPSIDLKMLYAINKNGSEIWVIKEDTKK